jgi:hypothetical protein
VSHNPMLKRQKRQMVWCTFSQILFCNDRWKQKYIDKQLMYKYIFFKFTLWFLRFTVGTHSRGENNVYRKLKRSRLGQEMESFREVDDLMKGFLRISHLTNHKNLCSNTFTLSLSITSAKNM